MRDARPDRLLPHIADDSPAKPARFASPGKARPVALGASLACLAAALLLVGVPGMGDRADIGRAHLRWVNCRFDPPLYCQRFPSPREIVSQLNIGNIDRALRILAGLRADPLRDGT
jgi:hypothetical protein